MTMVPVGSEVEQRPTFRGQAALKRLGSRVSWMYLIAGGLAVIAQGVPNRLELAGVLALLAATGWLVSAACARSRVDLLLAAVAINAVTAGVVVDIALDEGWTASALLGITVATGGAAGLALARPPYAGLLAAGVALAAMSLTANHLGSPIPALDLLGLPTSTVVATCIAVLTGRGFVETERALRGVDDALAMQRVASARLRAGRQADRALHDTVLTTLTMLSHRDFRFDPAPVRELCRRDLAFLGQDSWRVYSPTTSEPVLPPAALRNWSAVGLQVRWLGQLDQLDPVAGAAVLAAIEECLSNVARHAGVDVAEVVVSRQDGNLVVLVVDQGGGFDPDQVPSDRLGLAESVRGRLAELGGTVAVWSRPGAGTTVMLSVPVHP
jgi:anti-sigma regulatory factor (Ser/Thr protein kinase)